MRQHRVPNTIFILALCLLAGFLLQSSIPALTKSVNSAPGGSKTLELDVTTPDDPLEFGAEGLLTLSTVLPIH